MLKKLFNFYILLKFIYFFTTIKYGDISTSSLNISWKLFELFQVKIQAVLLTTVTDYKQFFLRVQWDDLP